MLRRFLEWLKLFLTEGYEKPENMVRFVRFVQSRELLLRRMLVDQEIVSLYRAWKKGVINIG